MKYDIQIMGRDELIYKAQSHKLDKCIVISINCPNNPTEIKNENIIDILKLEFHDIEVVRDGFVAMSMKDGYEIKEFIDKNKDVVTSIIIHCTAGISRSAGVGCAIAMYLNGSDNYLWSSGKYNPSERCYKTTLKSLGLKISDHDFMIKKELSDKGYEIAQCKFQEENGFKVSDMFF